MDNLQRESCLQGLNGGCSQIESTNPQKVGVPDGWHGGTMKVRRRIGGMNYSTFVESCCKRFKLNYFPNSSVLPPQTYDIINPDTNHQKTTKKGEENHERSKLRILYAG